MALKELEGCPPIQDISNFIDGLVGGEEKELLIAHFDECPVCYETLTSTLETQEEFPNLIEEKKPAEILEFKSKGSTQLLKNLRFSQKKLTYLVAASVAGIIGYASLQPQFTLNRPPSAFSVAQVINNEVKILPNIFFIYIPFIFSCLYSFFCCPYSWGAVFFRLIIILFNAFI